MLRLLQCVMMAVLLAACSTDEDSKADSKGQPDSAPSDSSADETGEADVGDTVAHPDTENSDMTDPGDQATSPDQNPTPDNLVQPDTVPADKIPFSCSSPSITEGWNEGWQVAGKNRSFFIDFPSQLGTKPLNVIFVFHGFGDSVNNFKAFFAPNPDADPDFPFVIVYPKSMALNPMGGGGGGIEWSVFNSEPGDENPDALFFEEMLGCIAQATDVNPNGVFAFGFSAGAIFTNLLHSRYPELLPTVLSMSGAWFNDEATVAKVNTMGMAKLNWTDLAKGAGTVFMTHGGANDTYGMIGVTIIDFELSASFALEYLTAAGRNVIDCPHTSGHTNHPQLSTAAMIKFFADHRAGGTSPWATAGIPASYPSGCVLHPAK